MDPERRGQCAQRSHIAGFISSACGRREVTRLPLPEAPVLDLGHYDPSAFNGLTILSPPDLKSLRFAKGNLPDGLVPFPDFPLQSSPRRRPGPSFLVLSSAKSGIPGVRRDDGRREGLWRKMKAIHAKALSLSAISHSTLSICGLEAMAGTSPPFSLTPLRPP